MDPSYLSDHIPQHPTPHVSLRSSSSRPPFSRTERYDNSFSPYCISNWNLLDSDIKFLSTLCEIKDKICKFFRPKGNSFYKIRDKYGIKLLTKIRVNFSDLRDHRYNHNFNYQNPSCACGLEDETTVHYFLCCPHYCQLRTIYLSRISDILGSDIMVLPNEHLSHILMYVSNVCNDVSNELIISETIQFIKQSGRFKKLEAFNQAT